MSEHTPAPTPARSLYGFFLYLFCKTFLVVYCLWAFTPDYYLHYFNIYYYPLKYWAYAIPIQLITALTIFGTFIYPSLNLMLVPSIDSLNTITDKYSLDEQQHNESGSSVSSKMCICTDQQNCSREEFLHNHLDDKINSVPQLYDLNIRFVCKKLYLNRF